MKKFSLLFLAIILTACSTSTQPQVTVTSEVTVTLLPPTATETLAPPTYTAPTATETVTMGGVIFTVDENGVMTKKEATGADAETKAENLAKVDPKAWGCENCTMVKDKTGTHLVAGGQNIALWVGTEWEWDGAMMEGLEGGNPLFRIAKTVEMNGRMPVPAEQKEARADTAEIRAFASEEAANKISGANWTYPILLYKEIDKSEAVLADFIEQNRVTDPNKVDSAVVDGWVCFKTTSGELVRMKFKDIKVFMRGFN